MKFSQWLLSSHNVSRDSVAWNASGSILWSAQSMLMVILISNFLGVETVGVFSFATAQAYLFWTIGTYGMRRYQASDVDRKYSFAEYRRSRVLTCAVMFLAAFGSCLIMLIFGSYTWFKAGSIMLATLIRMLDAVEDVYCGFYQRDGRLDVAGKITTTRAVLSIIVFAGAIVCGCGLLLSLSICLVVNVGVLIFFLRSASPHFLSDEEKICHPRHASSLLKTCLPLFITAFLTLYISNAPKYGIESVLGEKSQAYFNYLSMPSFVIQMLAMFIFNPMILRMSVAWTSGHMRQLIGDVIKVICLICGLTVAAVVAGYFFGLPILSWIYHRSDLNPFGSELTLLLISGGFIALSGFLTTVLTIMRRQRPMMIGFLLSAAVGLTANWWVSTGGLLGACLLNISLFAIQVLILGVVVIVTVGKRLHHV